jgi:hypothetical protein
MSATRTASRFKQTSASDGRVRSSASGDCDRRYASAGLLPKKEIRDWLRLSGFHSAGRTVPGGGAAGLLECQVRRLARSPQSRTWPTRSPIAVVAPGSSWNRLDNACRVEQDQALGYPLSQLGFSSNVHRKKDSMILRAVPATCGSSAWRCPYVIVSRIAMRTFGPVVEDP